VTMCVLCRRRTATVGYLDSTCLDRLADTLHAIERETQLLSAVPSLAAPTGTRGGTLASHRSPARIDAITLTDPRPWTDSALGVLHTWADTIRRDRSLDRTGHPTIASERRTLTRHLEHAATQPYIEPLAADLTALLRRLRHANSTPTPTPVGTCPNTYAGEECGGPIWRQPQTHTMWRHEGDRCTRSGTIALHDGPATCARCRATWTGPDLARLALILEHQQREQQRPHTPDGRPMYTATELVHQGHATSVSAVRVTAHRRGHRAVSGHYDPALFTPQETTA
jgi:hypothetical protein